MTQRTVTGTVLQPNGVAYTTALSFGLVEEIISSGIVVPAYTTNVMTASDGTFSVALYVPDSGTAIYLITLQSGFEQIVYLGAGTSITLAALLSIPTVMADPNYITELTTPSVTTVDDTYDIVEGDEYIRCDGTFIVTLPAAIGSFALYHILNVGTGTITVAVTGDDTVNSTTPNTLTTLKSAWYLDGDTGNWDSNNT